MKINLTFNRFLVLFVATLCFFACEKPINDLTTSTQKDPVMLSFKSYDDFQIMINKVSKMTESQIEAYEASQTGFVSIRKLYRQAMAEEEKNYDLEAAQKSKSHTKSRTLQLYPQMAMNMPEGGYEINLADERMASLLNVYGMVRVGNYIRQYTLQYNKAIFDNQTRSDETTLLRNRTADDPSIGLMVGQNRPLEAPKNARPSGEVIYTSRSCDEMDNGASPKKYRLIVYEESIMVDELVGAASTVNITASIPTVDKTGKVTYNNVTYTVPVKTQRIYYSKHTIKVRTLKRSTFGSWVDCQTTLQGVTGDFKLQGNLTYSYSTFGVLTNMIHYNNQSPTSTVTTYAFTLGESQKFGTATEAQNVRFESSSKHTGIWTKDNVTCTCKIGQ